MMRFKNKSLIFGKGSILRTTLAFSIAIVAVIGSITAALPSSTQFTAVQAQQNNSTAKTNTAKPVDGYGGPPTGPATAVRHVFDDPTLRVYHYCKPNDKIIMVCQLYDSDSPNATLIGIEYIIHSNAYKALPDREKPNWHYHKEEFTSAKANPVFPEINEQQQKEALNKLSETYGKAIITWNPNDKVPAFPPQVMQNNHPFMVNTTVTNQTETHAGSFNQTINY
jgi:Protein of unknown function (DUF1264)